MDRSFLEERRRDLTAQSWQELETRCRTFVRWAGEDCEVAQVDRKMAGRFVKEVVQARDVSSATRTKEISACRKWFTWLMVRGLIESNPFSLQESTIKESKRGKESARRPWTPSEILTFLDGVADDKREPNLWPLTVLALYSGMRLNEVASLRAEDYDRARGVFVLREGKSSAAVRDVPVHPLVARLVDGLTDGTSDGYLLPGLKPGGPDMKRGHGIAKTWGTTHPQVRD